MILLYIATVVRDGFACSCAGAGAPPAAAFAAAAAAAAGGVGGVGAAVAAATAAATAAAAATNCLFVFFVFSLSSVARVVVVRSSVGPSSSVVRRVGPSRYRYGFRFPVRYVVRRYGTLRTYVVVTYVTVNLNLNLS
eukprot:TRINITY_DN1963_c0_g1_i1.p1 TRINITY_DN1963_c0_g1~~TRINITY_DN1963_c0_g1_i1.p1  ORF type:complete len:137 (-),score=66.92 TRINITY_DN1963_c0_g1_i1:74-484(-)